MILKNKNIKRKKEKGFTLVELLAVIVILAIILVIAVPKVISVIEDSKKATLESTAKMIASQAEKQKVQNTVLGNNKEITCDSVAKINDVDYEDCDIDFSENTAKVTIKGSGKFNGLNVCGATKTGAVILPSCEGVTVISTKEDLLEVSETFSAYASLEGTYVLSNDIDLEGAEFKAIAAGYNKELTFIGNNHTISNVKVVESNHNILCSYGMFFAYYWSTLNITDLTLKNINIIDTNNDDDGGCYAGIVAGYVQVNVNLDNVDVINSKSEVSTNFKTNGIYFGFLEAASPAVTMSNCDTTGSSLSGGRTGRIGVAAGRIVNTLNITNCTKDITEWDWGGDVIDGGTLNIN